MPSGCQDVESSNCARTECGSTAIIEASGVQQSQGVAVSERGVSVACAAQMEQQGGGGHTMFVLHPSGIQRCRFEILLA